MRMGYFWPTLYRDVAQIVKRCKSCQRQAPQNRKPRHDMIPINSPWPFYKWAIDIVGPFPPGRGIFGIPRELVSDNGVQSAKDPFLSCRIQKHLNEKRNGWVDELSNILWAHRTTFKKITGETPFSLVYGSEAMILAEVFVQMHRVTNFDESANADNICENLNFIEERRLMAAIRETNNTQQIAKYYNKKVRVLAFDVGEWVLRNNEASLAEKLGKLGPNWEGPYQIVGINAAGSYKLQDIEGRHIPNAWHATLLKRYYM
ncbi:uncharacterized protein [Rutidosis leptorrhynchoides]|uniref:uncharacterized protein n=1 Tax=Rutidosis leptorrhynchoides TaxID=125765 RepID=UPI003A995DE2